MAFEFQPGVHHSHEDWDRFRTAKRIYLETSAFNRLFDEFSIPDLELTRAYQRRKGVIFVTSPMLLWEIMMVSDRQRADAMLHAAQALFDPVLLGTPTELAVRYLESAYHGGDRGYDVRSNLSWATLWPEMTRDFSRTFNYDFEEVARKTAPMRKLSKNLRSVIEGRPHADPEVDLVRIFVDTVFRAIADDLERTGLDDVTAKFVILYTLLLLMAHADLDGTAAQDFWLRRGFIGELQHAEVTRAFIDYPDIFENGPMLAMAMMAAFQHRKGMANRGAIHDGLHVSYAPYVHTVVSNDAAFLGIADTHPYFAARLLHMSQIDLRRVELPLTEYPEASQSR